MPRSLILVTIDCARADHMGFLGYPRGTTPFLDSVADESFVFRNAVASGVPTYYSLPALLASRYPLSLGRDLVGIAPAESTIATELRECGFKTAAFVAGNPYVSPVYGYENGFDTFRDYLSAPEPGLRFESGASESAGGLRRQANRLLSRTCHSLPALGTVYDELYFRYCQHITRNGKESLDGLRRFPSADVIVDSAIDWLNENSRGPFFLWLHFMDPHAPYYPKLKALCDMGCGHVTATEAKYLNSYWERSDLQPEQLERKRDSVVALYDAGLRWADSQIERLSRKLIELHLWQECSMAVTADHGEEFLEHGGRFHAPFTLYEELVRVPLLLRVPGLSERRDVTANFGLIDLAPTLLDTVQVPAPANFRGRSWWHKILNGQSLKVPVFTECVHGCSNPMDQKKRRAPRLLAVREGMHKLILNFESATDLLFDLNADPGELSPLSPDAATETRRYLLDCARKHVADTRRSRDFDLRLATQLRDLRSNLVRPGMGKPN